MNINKNTNKNVLTIVLVLLLTFAMTFLLLKVNARSSTVTEHSILTKVNKLRLENKLPELVINNRLNIAAKTKAMDMKLSNYFSHNSPNNVRWSDFIINSGYSYTVAGENLAKGYFTTEDLMRDWVNSKTHKENIIYNEFVETGISVLDTDNQGVLIVQVFGKPSK
ncbi:MAG: CAP domain-containing protein [Patescibacteria group bacterium]